MLTFHILNVYVDKNQPHQFKYTFKFSVLTRSCISQNRQVKVSASLSDILEQKSALAYDNGRLHRSVEQLHQDLESCGAMKAELGQLRKSHKTLEGKYAKVCVAVNVIALVTFVPPGSEGHQLNIGDNLLPSLLVLGPPHTIC